MPEHAEDVSIQFGGNVVGYATSFSMPQLGNEVEVTGLGDNWKDFDIADLEATMDVDELFVPSLAAHTALETAFRTKATVAVQWRTVLGYGYSGTAIVTRMEAGASVGGAVTLGISLRFKGATVVKGAIS